MNSAHKLFAALSVASVAVLGSLYLLRNKQSRPAKSGIAKEQLKEVLSEIKSQSFSLFITTAGVVQKIMAECGNKYELQDGRNVGDLIRSEVQLQFEDKQKLILIKYNLEVDQFITAINDEFKNEEEVQEIVNNIYDGLENSLKGIGPSIEVPERFYNLLPKDKSLDIIKKILIQSSKIYLQVMKELSSIDGKSISIQDPKVIRRIGEINLKLQKKSLMENEGVVIEPESPTEILGKVTQKYKQDDTEYSARLIEVQRKYISVQDRLNNEIKTEEHIDREYE